MARERPRALLQRERQANGPAHLRGERGGQRLDLGVALAAERAPDERHHDLHRGEWQIEDLGQIFPHRERMLGARPHGDAVAVHAGDGAVGLEGVMRQRGIVIRALDDEVGLGERAREIAALELVVLADVGSRNGAEPAEIAEVTGALDLRMEQRSRGSKRLLGVRRRRQLFVAHVNEPQRCGRLGFGLGDHRDHGLARVADHLVGEDRLVAVGGTEVEALDRKIGGRAHGQDSGCRGRALPALHSLTGSRTARASLVRLQDLALEPI